MATLSGWTCHLTASHRERLNWHRRHLLRVAVASALVNKAE